MFIFLTFVAYFTCLCLFVVGVNIMHLLGKHVAHQIYNDNQRYLLSVLVDSVYALTKRINFTSMEYVLTRSVC